MIKFYLLATILCSSLIFGQTPIITMIADGDCTGGTPKLIEIYAHGTVDFSLYSVENQTNSNTTWGNSVDLSSFGTVTDDFVYVYYDGSNDTFSTEFPSATLNLESNTLNINGDDRIRIIETFVMPLNVVDQFGVEGTDGTGSTWEYKDGYSKRNNMTGPNGANFVDTEWSHNNGSLDGLGTCQGGSTFESIIGIGTYIPQTLSISDVNTFEDSVKFSNTLVSENFTVSLKGKAQIEVYNMNGQLVHSTSGSDEILVNASSYNQGTYIVIVSQEGNTLTQKIIKK